MSITVVAGGQFGGEGKGKVTAHLCRSYDYDLAIRCGGPNSGHTVVIDDESVVLRQVPAGVVNPETRLCLSAGCIIDMDVLNEEIDRFSLTPERLGVDRNAVIIKTEHKKAEKDLNLNDRIGSTCTGTGVAVAGRVLRGARVVQARNVRSLEPYLSNVAEEVMTHYQSGNRIVVEGTQGFGLSLYHSPYYPYTTSRDTTASAFLSEVGVSPTVVSSVIMVIRTFPIRVGGNSGPLPNEVDWDIVRQESGYPFEIQEFTTVTRKRRRVARFDNNIVRRAITANAPTVLALMGIDYVDYKNVKAQIYSDLTPAARGLVESLEEDLGVRIGLIGTGQEDCNLVDRMVDSYGKQEREGVQPAEGVFVS